MNNLNLIGRLTKNVEVRNIKNTENKIATFVIAVDRDFTKKDGTRDTDFIPVEFGGSIAEFCERNLTKGRLVAVEGALQIDSWTNDQGEKKTYTKVRGKRIQPLDKKKIEANFASSAVTDDELPFE